MTMTRMAGAAACLVVFGGLAVAMGASARNDWREGRRRADRATMFFALEEWWPTLIAAAVAVVGTAYILLG